VQTFLIVGGSKEERLKKAEETVGQKLTSLKNNPDFSFLQLVENSIGISEIRDLQKKLVLKPFQEEQKTVLIHEAQNLTPEAQNALLKTLEEPPLLSKIILTVPETSWLLPTIVSRCQIIRLPSLGLRIDNEDSQKILSIFNLLIKPLLNLLLLPVNLLTLGAFRWVVNVVTLFLVTLFVPGFRITNFSFVGLSFSGFVIPAFNLSFFWSLILVSFLIEILFGFINWIFK